MSNCNSQKNTENGQGLFVFGPNQILTEIDFEFVRNLTKAADHNFLRSSQFGSLNVFSLAYNINIMTTITNFPPQLLFIDLFVD